MTEAIKKTAQHNSCWMCTWIKDSWYLLNAGCSTGLWMDAWWEDYLRGGTLPEQHTWDGKLQGSGDDLLADWLEGDALPLLGRHHAGKVLHVDHSLSQHPTLALLPLLKHNHSTWLTASRHSDLIGCYFYFGWEQRGLNVYGTAKKKRPCYLVGNLVATNWPIEKALHAIGYNQIPTK